MSGTGWAITLGIIYLVLLVVFAVLSFRKGHWVLGLIGFIFPQLLGQFTNVNKGLHSHGRLLHAHVKAMG